MSRMNPRTMILLGFILVLFGFIVPFLMVIQIIEAGFFLSFLSYGASMAGLFLGLIGAAWYSRRDRRR
jgi:vacuolar-type H+-ATPase subunit I/STV1